MIVPLEKPGSPAELVHHGIKGQKWGVRNEERNTSSLPGKSFTVKGLDHYPKAQAAAMNDVAQKINNAYGFKIDSFSPVDKTKNYVDGVTSDKVNYLAVVVPKTHGSTHNSILVSNGPEYTSTLKRAQTLGWFSPTDSKHLVEGNITHEAAHGLFHQNDSLGKGVTYNSEARIFPLRQSAWAKAEQQAINDGDISRKRFGSNTRSESQFQMATKLSKYAQTSPFIEEHEAELFSAYHWSPNPPKFVDAFMKDVHTNMGVKVQPFSGRTISDA